MAFYTFDCPHWDCGAKNSAFDSKVGYRAKDGDRCLVSVCQTCGKPVIFHLRGDFQPAAPLENYSLEALLKEFRLITTSPTSPSADTIDALPANVNSAYKQAESNRTMRNWAAAAVMYRAAIERTLKDKFPEGRGMLHQRIRALEGSKALPHSLIELLDQVKFLGNEGAHDIEDPDGEDVIRGRDFTRLFLVYLYELPTKIEAAKERRDGAGPVA